MDEDDPGKAGKGAQEQIGQRVRVGRNAMMARMSVMEVGALDQW